MDCSCSLKVLESFEKMITLFEELAEQATTFKSPAIPSLLRTAPDMRKELVNLRGLFKADDAGKRNLIHFVYCLS